MKFSAVLMAVMPLASAWRLQLYRDESYRNIIEDRSGTVGQPCKNLAAGNVASSMHWDSSVLCEIKLFNWRDCQEAGGILGRSRGTWNLPNFSSQANDKVESYKITC